MSKPSPMPSARPFESVGSGSFFLRSFCSAALYCQTCLNPYNDSNSGSNIPDPMFLGVILNWGLFCCLAIQVYIYYISSKKDRIGLKFFGFATYYARQILVVSWSKMTYDGTGIPAQLGVFLFGVAENAAAVLPIINAIISAAVQIFFSWRIWFLNRTTTGRIFAVLIGIVWLAGNFLADVLITLSMLYTLRMAQRRSLSKGAKIIISRLMVNAVETGAVTAIVVGVGLALSFLSDQPTSEITVNQNFGGLILMPYRFPNVCLANLNARARIRRLGNDPQFSTVHAGERDPESGRVNTTLRFARRSTILARGGTTESRVHVDMGVGPAHIDTGTLEPTT
ncbi:hypothetical protein BD779DRAFT_1471812 [Infundibulicybe gibba]|nr:hypothetical protein BD779DRAFT_1471812 [Infundibulicybe gibba]